MLSRLCSCKVKKNSWTLEWRWRPSAKGHKALVGMYSATRTPRELKVGGAEMGFWTMCEDSQEACSKDPGCYDFFFQDRFVTEMDDGVRVHA